MDKIEENSINTAIVLMLYASGMLIMITRLKDNFGGKLWGEMFRGKFLEEMPYLIFLNHPALQKYSMHWFFEVLCICLCLCVFVFVFVFL